MSIKELGATEELKKNPSENLEESDEGKVSDDDLSKKSDESSLIMDVTGKSLDFSLSDSVDSAVEMLYMYKNIFNLIPAAGGGMKRLKTLKFFANELNLFPSGLDSLPELESLQVKVPEAPNFGGFDLGKLKVLKELELSRVPLKPSAFPSLSEIAGLSSLTKLTVCHFSIRNLPPEIGHLNKLEYLDLSFNKMRNLPTEIIKLKSLISLKVANNKLVELPSGLSSLERLENLDLSNNRLTSLGSLDLESMYNLQQLDLQQLLRYNQEIVSRIDSTTVLPSKYNMLLSCCQIPSWICCNLDGNGKDISIDEFISSSTAMDVLECGVDECSQSGSSVTSMIHLSESSSNNRCFARRKSKGWKRRHSLQQKARQERLNNSRKWNGQKHVAVHRTPEKIMACKPSENVDEYIVESESTILVSEVNDEEFFSGDVPDDDVSTNFVGKRNSQKSLVNDNLIGDGCTTPSVSKGSVPHAVVSEDVGYSSDVCNNISKSKRHSDQELDSLNPRKHHRPTDGPSDISSKYSKTSFCSFQDYIPDGFYDAGRDRPFMPLSFYEQNLLLESREVILVDRVRDERLDAIVNCARALVSHFRQISGSTAINTLQIATLLAYFVSDHFGGSDKSSVIERTRKAVSGSNYMRPFVCTCPTGNGEGLGKNSTESENIGEDIVFANLCERALQSVKARQKSVVVPIGTLQFGVCRHRAVLMKYLCDRMEPPIPCELVRGFIDFSPHAWNIVGIRRGQSSVRMIVDACHPHDIREEMNLEYFCRYIPLSRITISNLEEDSLDAICSFPACNGSKKPAEVTSLIQCKLGSIDAAAKVRTLEVDSSSVDEVRRFELDCIGEVRMLGSLKHNCIVKYYGHHISSKWVPSPDGESNIRVLQSAILMEYIKGGSLKCYLEKLVIAGEKSVPILLALVIARDVAGALAELHSKHIIHRDIKSHNVLIDMNEKKTNENSPTVKLCDFDRAIPLRSSLHSCCIAHAGVPARDACVGTPRWMAPEVFRAFETNEMYGLEVDIWSFGCLLLELLTLKVPYCGLPESDINKSLKAAKRPKLTTEMEKSTPLTEDIETQISSEMEGLPDDDSKCVNLLVCMYRWCTEGDPADRPTAEKLHKLLSQASSITGPPPDLKEEE